MEPEAAFKEFQTTVNADPDQLTEARRRRDAFVSSFEAEDDINEALVIGSLRRKTQLAPIKDVDIVVVFDPDDYPDWPAPGPSADDAISLTADRVSELLGKEGSQVGLLDPDGKGDCYVRLTRRRRHAVKCFIDDPDAEDGFTIDLVPALRHEDHGLWIPERNIDQPDMSIWIRTDPEYMINLVAGFQESWDLWIPTMRMLKYWNKEAGAGMSSLYAEVLATTEETLPTDTSRTEAIQRFFTSAEIRVSAHLADPAQLCGPIQPDLDVSNAKTRISEAASLSWKALQAERREAYDEAICLWRDLFGDEFPEPSDGCEQDDSAALGATAYIGARRVKDSPQGCATN